MWGSDENWLDEASHPLWVQTFPVYCSTDELAEAFDHLDARVRAAVHERVRIAVMVDVTRARTGSAVNRKRISETFEETERIAAHIIVAQAFVVRTKFQRGALRAVLWLSNLKPSWKIRVFIDRTTARAWLSEMLATDFVVGSSALS